MVMKIFIILKLVNWREKLRNNKCFHLRCLCFIVFRLVSMWLHMLLRILEKLSGKG